jgi:hypothetical protein
VKPASIRPVWGFRVTRVPSDVTRVTFYTKILVFVESDRRINPLPRGASVGEFRKTHHPRNVEFNEILKMCFFRGKAFAIFKNLESAKPRNREHAIFRNLESAKPRNRKHATFGNLEPVKPRSHEHAEVCNLELEKS